MRNGYIYLVVIVSGASVLALEILGTRILGPFYGVSLFLWSALITVTLAALSLGYAIGGRWADAGPRVRRLSVLLLLAGLWVVVVPWLSRPVLVVAAPFGLRLAVLVAATILFFPPLTLLGMVSPYAIRLKASGIDVVGRTAGNLYAVSTVASVGAALLVGFFLIPKVGVVRLTLGTGIVLIGTSLVGFAGGEKRYLRVFLAVLTVVAVVSACAFLPAGHRAGEGVVAVEESSYGEVRVVDKDGLRYLLIDGGIHTVIDSQTPSSQFGYVNVLGIAKRYFERPGKMLLVGLGGGALVKDYSRDGWTVAAVEIDPVVTRVAREHFGLQPQEAAVHHADDRRFLSTSAESFDLIIVDAFGSGSIPFQLVTREAFEIASSRLSKDGILALNVQSMGWHGIIVRSLAATLACSFNEVLALPIVEPPNAAGNVVLLAASRPLGLADEPGVPIDRLTPEYDQFHAWENRFEPDTRGAPILTDDLNPSDLWGEAVNLAVRKEGHEFFGKSGMDW